VSLAERQSSVSRLYIIHSKQSNRKFSCIHCSNLRRLGSKPDCTWGARCPWLIMCHSRLCKRSSGRHGATTRVLTGFSCMYQASSVKAPPVHRCMSCDLFLSVTQLIHFQRYTVHHCHYFKGCNHFHTEATVLSILVCVFELAAAGLTIFRTLTALKAEALRSQDLAAFILRQGKYFKQASDGHQN